MNYNKIDLSEMAKNLTFDQLDILYRTNLRQASARLDKHIQKNLTLFLKAKNKNNKEYRAVLRDRVRDMIFSPSLIIAARRKYGPKVNIYDHLTAEALYKYCEKVNYLINTKEGYQRFQNILNDEKLTGPLFANLFNSESLTTNIKDARKKFGLTKNYAKDIKEDHIYLCKVNEKERIIKKLKTFELADDKKFATTDNGYNILDDDITGYISPEKAIETAKKLSAEEINYITERNPLYMNEKEKITAEDDGYNILDDDTTGYVSPEEALRKMDALKEEGESYLAEIIEENTRN